MNGMLGGCAGWHRYKSCWRLCWATTFQGFCCLYICCFPQPFLHESSLDSLESYVLSVTFAQEYIAPEVLLNKGHGSSARSWSCTWHVSSVHARIGSHQSVASLAILDIVKWCQICDQICFSHPGNFPLEWKISLHQKPMKVKSIEVEKWSSSDPLNSILYHFVHVHESCSGLFRAP